MGLRATQIHFSDNAERSITELQKRSASDAKAASVLRRVDSLRVALRSDALRGEVVKKPLPRQLVSKYGIDNLFVEDVPDFWRLLYTIVRKGNERHLVVLEIVDHRTYDAWFPGRGR